MNAGAPVPLPQARLHPVTPDDHSKLAPILPIPNRTVKRLRADDSAAPRVKVGHRQALILSTTKPPGLNQWGVFAFRQRLDRAIFSMHLPDGGAAQGYTVGLCR